MQNSISSTKLLGWPLKTRLGRNVALSVICFANASSPGGGAKISATSQSCTNTCLSLWESNCPGDSLIRESEATTETVARRSRDGEGYVASISRFQRISHVGRVLQQARFIFSVKGRGRSPAALLHLLDLVSGGLLQGVGVKGGLPGELDLDPADLVQPGGSLGHGEGEDVASTGPVL